MKRDCGENVNSEREKKPACECITRSDPIAREWLFVWFASIHLSKLSFTARSGQWPTENNLTKTTSKCICFQFSIICFTSLSNSISFAVLFVRSFGMLLVVSCVLTISQWIEFENDFFLLSLSSLCSHACSQFSCSYVYWCVLVSLFLRIHRTDAFLIGVH